MPNPASRAHWAMLAVVLIWGANFTVTKAAIVAMPPLGFTAIRFTAGSLLLWAILRWREGPVPIAPGDGWRLAALGVVGNTLYQLCFILGLARTTATNSALLLAAMPTAVTVLAGALGVERVAARVRIGIAIATAGVVVVMAARGAGLGRATLVGDALMLAAVACWAVFTIGLRQMSGRYTPLQLTTWTLITGTPGLVLAGLPQLLGFDWTTVTAAGWAGLAYATLLSLVLAYLLWNAAVGSMGPSRTAIYTCTTPLVATLIATVSLGERPTAWHALGALLIVGGVLWSRLAPAPEAT